MSDEHQFDGKKFADDLRDRIHQRVSTGIYAQNRRIGRSNGLIPGIALVVIGTIFLLDHMGIVHAETLWRFWPLLIVAVGFLKLTQPGEHALGVGFIVVGGLVQLHQLGLIGLSWGTIWPFILILAGAALIWGRFEARNIPGIPGADGTPGVPGMPGTLSSGGSGRDTVNEYALFGGVERRVTINNFRGGNVTAIFGGVDLDFRSADIEGEEANIYVEAVFGGIEIVVPERWNVTFQVQSIFAGYSDETRQPLPDAVGATPRKTLVLHGRATFGGITVKN
jgi:predicted membrane protein